MEAPATPATDDAAASPSASTGGATPDAASGALRDRRRARLGGLAQLDSVEALRRALDETVREAALDPLTGLPNRRAALEHLEAVCAHANPVWPVSVCFVDVDRFKVINDLYGHEVGDRVLVDVARGLQRAVRHSDRVARLAGDEFLVVAQGAGPEAAMRLADRVQRAIGPTVDLGHRQVPLSVSVGVAVAERPTPARELIARADAAMYRAKQEGRCRAARYDEAMHAEFLERSAIERQLTTALQDGQLTVQYQPMVELGSGAVRGFEAFVRWQHPTRGLLPASVFVPIATAVGGIWAIDAFMLAEAGRQAAEWQRAHPGHAGLIMSVNVSAQQFRDGSVVDSVRSAVESTGVDPATFQLEVSEATLLGPDGSVSDAVAALDALGVRLAVDNFGAASSSLACLKQLPLDALKIDRRFTAGLGGSADDEAIVGAVLGLGQAFGLEVVAEGIEEDRQVDWLVDAGCRFGQGYRFSRPVDADTASTLLTP